MNSVRVVGVVLFLVGAVKLYAAVAHLVRSRRAARWPKVRGEVVVRTVTEDHSTEIPYEPLVTYRFLVRDRVYVGSRTFSAWESHAQAEAALAGYRKGGAVLVHYNPENPKESMLDPGDLSDTGLDLLGGILAVGMGAGLFLLI